VPVNRVMRFAVIAITVAVAAGVAAAGFVGAAAPRRAPQAHLPTGLLSSKWVRGLSMDGDAVAVAWHDVDCFGADVWYPRTGRVIHLPHRCGQPANDAGEEHTRSYYVALTLAGERLFWVDYDEAQETGCIGIYTTTIAKPSDRQLVMPNLCRARLGRSPDPVFYTADGDGPLLVVEHSEPGETIGSTEDVDVLRLVGARTTQILSRGDDIELLSVSAGRLAVRRGSTVFVYSASGRELLRFPHARSARLDYGRVIVRRPGRLDEYSIATGSRILARPLNADAELIDAAHGVVLYSTRDAATGGHDVLHLLRLADGHVRTIAPYSKLVGAEVEAAGIVYAFTPNADAAGAVPPPHDIVTFVPLARVFEHRTAATTDQRRGANALARSRVPGVGASDDGAVAFASRFGSSVVNADGTASRWLDGTASTWLTEDRARPGPGGLSLEPSRVLKTASLVKKLSADAGRAALEAPGEDGCGPIGIWNPGASFKWIPGSSCAAGMGFPFDHLHLVLAGRYAAWTTWVDALPQLSALVTATAASKPVYVDEEDGGTTSDDAEDVITKNLGHLAGDGSLLVYNTWTANYGPSGSGRPRIISRPTLWRVVDGRTKVLVTSGEDARDVVAVDAGRIAVLRPDGTFVILDEQGGRLSAFDLDTTGLAGLRLTGSRLVVLRRTAIEVYDLVSGALEHRWPTVRTRGQVRLEDADGGFAVYTVGIAIHLLRLSDGRDRALSIPKEAGPAHADLEPEGLYYSYSETGSAKPGRVAFVPLRHVTARFK
jgi:hypothetical protein